MVPLHEFAEALRYDPTLAAFPSDLAALKKKYLAPLHYSQEQLFKNMFRGKTVVFQDYPINYPVSDDLSKTDLTLHLLRNNLKGAEKIFIRYGSNRTLKKVTIHDVIERWVRGQSKFGVTDLHFRQTKFFRKIDAGSISYFNLLPLFPEKVSFLEMLTLVISSKGIFSDSHSDDGDGSNHCIVGKKLWLAWDKEEGAKAGLQDCTYDNVYDQAKFSIKKFLSLKSSHWFLVAEGQTLFMPGNFTHKVVTLESYIGFGSFYVSFPNYINSIKRWTVKYSSDVTPSFVETLNKKCLQYIREKILLMKPEEKEKIGFPYLLKGIEDWRAGLDPEQRKAFSSNMSNNDFISGVQKMVG